MLCKGNSNKLLSAHSRCAVLFIAIIAMLAATVSISSAIPKGKIAWKDTKMGEVPFSGSAHSVQKCNDCHTKIFRMKKGQMSKNPTPHRAGVACGTCHDGTRASKECKTCHVKSRSDYARRSKDNNQYTSKSSGSSYGKSDYSGNKPESSQSTPAYKSKDTSPPDITITSHNTRSIKIKSSNKRATVQGIARDSSGIVEVMVNGNEARLDAQGNFQSDIFLVVGNNNITVTAMDGKGNRANRKFSIVREGAVVSSTPKAAPTAGRNEINGWYSRQHAVVIGIDRYQSRSINRLRNAVNDAKSISAMFKKMGFTVTELYDREATRKNILKSFRNITKNARSNDSFVFYFAGHGQGLVLENKNQVGYIIPFDADINLSNSDVILYDEEAIPLNTLKKYAMNMKSKHVAMLLDSCFSGLAMKRSLPKLGRKDMEYYNNILNRRTINLLTAGDDQPVSDGSGHSPFTKAILNALDRGNLDINDRDGLATFTELAAYVKGKVEKATGRRQRPQFDNLSDDDGDFVFRIK